MRWHSGLRLLSDARASTTADNVWPAAASATLRRQSNSTLAILKTFAELGAGFDIVSGGELSRVLAAGGNPESVVFGVGKSVEEIDFALKIGIECFNGKQQRTHTHQ